MAKEKRYNIKFDSKGTKQVSREVSKMERASQKLTASLKNVALGFAGIFSVAAIANLVRGTIQTAAQFEMLKVRLTALYGSVERGTQAFNKFNEVAATTP